MVSDKKELWDNGLKYVESSHRHRRMSDSFSPFQFMFGVIGQGPVSAGIAGRVLRYERDSGEFSVRGSACDAVVSRPIVLLGLEGSRADRITPPDFVQND